ncbi:MAG TPA: NUDIX hydrolase [Mycobacteriales bacterium]|nr:NUDIX hydrolase [Mycobacteriales bacterium]
MAEQASEPEPASGPRPSGPQLPADAAATYPVLERHRVYTSGRVIAVDREVVELPNGGAPTRDVVRHPGAVGVIALDDTERVLLVQQYRHAPGRLLWEPPAGLLDVPGEAALAAAQRELFEEAHYVARRWHVLVDLFTSPGMSDEAVRVYLAREVQPASADRHVGQDEERDMPTSWVPIDDAVALVFAGALHNPLAVTGILAAARARELGYANLRAVDAPWPDRVPQPPTGADAPA